VEIGEVGAKRTLAELQNEAFTGISYDGGETSLPYAVRWRGQIERWEPNEQSANKTYERIVRLRQRRNNDHA